MGGNSSQFKKEMANDKTDVTSNKSDSTKTSYNDQIFVDHKKDYGDRIGGNKESIIGMVNERGTVSFKLINL